MEKFSISDSNLIGTTETYDPSYDYSWTSNLKPVNIIITKNLTDKMIECLNSTECRSSCILHLTVTGWGGNKYMEPGVKDTLWSYNQYKKLISYGFEESHVVLRVDPILPTHLGINVAKLVLDTFSDTNIIRVRVSSLDMYNHVKDRIRLMGFDPPYESFHAPKDMLLALDDMLNSYSSRYEFESCAEAGRLRVPYRVGCVSEKDVDIINPKFKVDLIGESRQRSTCLCPKNKVQIIKTKPRRCPNKCIYCYWKD